MSRKQQQNLFDQTPKRGRKPLKPHGHFGGMYLKNYNPKSKRPMDSKKALHVVLRSSKATGAKSFKNSKYETAIWDIVYKHAKNKGIRIYEYANGGNHLHLLIRAKHRKEYSAFIRTITGLIARLVSGKERGGGRGRGSQANHQKTDSVKKKFWDGRPFSRVVSFAKREFETAKTYLLRNMLEAIGWMPYFSRSQRLPKEWREWLNPAAMAPGYGYGYGYG